VYKSTILFKFYTRVSIIM